MAPEVSGSSGPPAGGLDTATAVPGGLPPAPAAEGSGAAPPAGSPAVQPEGGQAKDTAEVKAAGGKEAEKGPPQPEWRKRRTREQQGFDRLVDRLEEIAMDKVADLTAEGKEAPPKLVEALAVAAKINTQECNFNPDTGDFEDIDPKDHSKKITRNYAPYAKTIIDAVADDPEAKVIMMVIEPRMQAGQYENAGVAEEGYGLYRAVGRSDGDVLIGNQEKDTAGVFQVLQEAIRSLSRVEGIQKTDPLLFRELVAEFSIIAEGRNILPPELQIQLAFEVMTRLQGIPGIADRIPAFRGIYSELVVKNKTRLRTYNGENSAAVWLVAQLRAFNMIDDVVPASEAEKDLIKGFGERGMDIFLALDEANAEATQAPGMTFKELYQKVTGAPEPAKLKVPPKLKEIIEQKLKKEPKVLKDVAQKAYGDNAAGGEDRFISRLSQLTGMSDKELRKRLDKFKADGINWYSVGMAGNFGLALFTSVLPMMGEDEKQQ